MSRLIVLLFAAAMVSCGGAPKSKDVTRDQARLLARNYVQAQRPDLALAEEEKLPFKLDTVSSDVDPSQHLGRPVWNIIVRVETTNGIRHVNLCVRDDGIIREVWWPDEKQPRILAKP